MNSIKYRNEEYPIRQITDIKELVGSSASLYQEQAAYLVKDTLGGEYRPISFRQVLADMNAFGTALLELGLSGKKIAVIGESRYEWILTYLTAVSGVGVIVPIERELPTRDIRHLLQRAKASAIVYSEKMEAEIQEATWGLENIEYRISMDEVLGCNEQRESQVLCLPSLIKRGKELVEKGQRNYIDAPIDPAIMSILLFTSGTTGLSKGVMLSHNNIVSNIMELSRYVNVNGFVGLSVLPMHHTYEMTAHILSAFYQGCTVAICEGLKYIQKNLVESKANIMLGVPLIFESMHKRLWKQAEKTGKAEKLRKAVNLSKKFKLYNTGIAKKLFKEVHKTLGGEIKLLVSGAAAIDPEVIEDFQAMGLPMMQGYGMTECSPIIAVNKDRYSKAAAAGLALPNTEIKIVDPDENGIGEIICKSDSVMLGYYDNPEETSLVLQNGWLYTGDYGYMDDDGFLYITGRKKNVIVTKNGKNIFPEEVEFYLAKSNYIAECVVYGVEDKDSGETVVCADLFPDFPAIEEVRADLSEIELRKLLKDEVSVANGQMPAYKRVKRFDIRKTEFEKTATKKIKRHLAGHVE